jgi:hypothetical protein
MENMAIVPGLAALAQTDGPPHGCTGVHQRNFDDTDPKLQSIKTKAVCAFAD